VGRALAKLPMCGKLESLVSHNYVYFSHSNKRGYALKELQAFVGVRELATLNSCDTRWFSNMPAMNRMWTQYPALVFFYSQEVEESPGNMQASNMLQNLTDLEMMLSIPAMLPLLKCLNTFVKDLQREEVDLYNLAGLLRSTRTNIRNMFGLLPEEEVAISAQGAHGRFKTIAHDDFNRLAYGTLDQLELRWVGEDGSHLALVVSHPGPEGQTLQTEFPLTCVPPATGHRGRPNTRSEPVTSELFNSVLDSVERTMQEVARFTLGELDERFPCDADLEVFGVLNPEWWNSESDAPSQARLFGESVVGLADWYGMPMETLVGGAKVAPPLDGNIPKNQSTAFMGVDA